jgi:hypothetical protein
VLGIGEITKLLLFCKRLIFKKHWFDPFHG